VNQFSELARHGRKGASPVQDTPKDAQQNIQLYQKHVRAVYGFFMVKTFHRQLAEDLTSDVFTAAFEQFGNPALQIADQEKYLYGVMKLIWLQYLRKKYERPEADIEYIDNFGAYAAQEVQATRERSLIDRALPYIEQLPESQRTVLLLRFRDGLAPVQIAVQLGRNMNYVKTTQKRGLASLKRMIEGERI
jgi:RNA polymerase sigma factor (sigma-70 family)